LQPFSPPLGHLLRKLLLGKDPLPTEIFASLSHQNESNCDKNEVEDQQL
jgi:hypothetical protein